MTERSRLAEVMDLKAMSEEELDPELAEWVEEGTWGPMLRHPLVYSIPLMLPGQANQTLYAKRAAILRAVEAEDWHSVVFLHERPYRLKALIDYVTGRDEYDEVLSLMYSPEHTDLAVSVWIDSENIEQHVEEWRALFADCTWLGDLDEQAAFDALPDPIPAYRGGVVGDWSWTTDIKIAEFFAKRLGAGREVRHAMIPKADVFAYLLGRGESELLVRLTDERRPLVYPGDEQSGE